MTAPVTKARIAIAAKKLQNAEAAAVACRKAGLPFFAACALLEKESGGRNVYGHDKGGVNTVKGDLEVTRDNFLAFLMKVMNGATSNGVGPLQITYAGALDHGHRDGGYFRLMLTEGLMPWIPEDNMLQGFRILAANYKRTGDWTEAAAMYNGGPHPNEVAMAYGRDFKTKLEAWKRAFGI